MAKMKREKLDTKKNLVPVLVRNLKRDMKEDIYDNVGFPGSPCPGCKALRARIRILRNALKGFVSNGNVNAYLKREIERKAAHKAQLKNLGY